MVLHCIVPNCPNKYKSKATVGIAFHKFPINRPDLLKEWLKNLEIRSDFLPLKNTAICSAHFERKHLRVQGNHFYIRKMAVPTILPKGDVYNGFTIPTPSLDWDSDPDKKINEKRAREKYLKELKVKLKNKIDDPRFKRQKGIIQIFNASEVASESSTSSYTSSSSTYSSSEDSGSECGGMESEQSKDEESMDSEQKNEEDIKEHIRDIQHDHIYLSYDHGPTVSKKKYDHTYNQLKQVRWKLKLSQQKLRRLQQRASKLKETVAEQRKLLNKL